MRRVTQTEVVMRRLTQRLLAIVVVLGFCGLVATTAQAAAGPSGHQAPTPATASSPSP